MLIVTSDFGSVMRCNTYDDLVQVAQTMISGRPDIQVLDSASGDVCYYKSAIGRYWSENNADPLREAGLDPLAIMLDRIKTAGISVLAGLRVNDHHGIEEAWTPWQREHVQWSLGKDTGDRSWRAVGNLRQMDYAVEGVRKHYLSIIKEIVTRYDVDGIQLDFGRTAPFLSEPKREKAGLMTQYIRDVHAVLEEMERGLILGAIVPWDIDFCEREGLEVGRWISEGLISHISPGEWYYVEWNIPVARWAELTGGSDCRLVPMTCTTVAMEANEIVPLDGPGLDRRPLLGEDKLLTGPMIRALAETAYYEGADGFALYNFYADMPAFQSLYPSIRDWTAPARIPSATRHYFFCHRLGYQPHERYWFTKGEPFARFPLRAEGEEIGYPFRFGSDLSASAATFRLKLKNMTEEDEVAVAINGTTVAPQSVQHVDYSPPGGEAYRVAIWAAPVGAPPLALGENEVRVRLLKCDPARPEEVQAGEFEIWVEPE